MRNAEVRKMTVEDDPIADAFFATSISSFKKCETWIRMHIRPKPRWAPTFVWYALLLRLVVMTEFKRGAIQK